MVSGVQAIIQQQEIQQFPSHIAGVVEIRFFIGMDVLDVVENKDGKKGNLLGNDNIQQSLFPINQQGNQYPRNEGNDLK